jgi:polyisoprenyl-teichoic acid--peptidoglycan teichoic acid transferase
MTTYKQTFLLLLILVLTACSTPGLTGGAPIAAAPLPTSTPSAPLYQVPSDATATPTPFQPLPPTPVYIPAGASVSTEATPEPTLATPPPQNMSAVGMIQPPKGVMNILLLGSDQRSRKASLFRTDTIILASLNPEKGTVSLVSFPRDLWVQIPGYGQDRINTAYERGGFKTLADTLQYNFGVHPDHFVVIKFSSFKQVIDSLGGLEVNVGETLTDRRGFRYVTIPKGKQTMSADTVLWYVRSRKTTNDFARNRRQQEVLQAIGNKLMSMDAIRRAPELYSAYINSVTTDLNLIDMLTFLPLAAQLSDTSRIHHYFVSPAMASDWITPGGAMVLIPNREAIVNVLRKALKGD